MATPRKQVEGLRAAIPVLQPSIPQTGTGRIVPTKVTPFEQTRLGQLSRGLGVAVEGARELKAIGDIQKQKAIDELADKSIEDLNKEFLNNRAKLDKEVRNNFLPFMANPWNQERVRKAAGAQYHDEFQLRLQQALDKSDATTDTDTVVQDVIAVMTEDYESLKDVTIRQGFDSATKNTIQKYSLRYNSIKSQQNRGQLTLAGKSVLFNASTLVDNEIADPEAINEWWVENEGALKPGELSALRKEVIVLHASRGNFEAARKFQEYTANFKAGTTKMGDPDTADDDVFGMYSAEEAKLTQTLDDMELKADGRLIADSKLKLREVDELAVDIGLAIRSGQGYKKEDGTIIKTTEEAEAYLLDKLQESDNILVRGSSGVSVVQNALKSLEMPSDENFIKLKEKYARATTGPMAFNFRYKQVIEKFNQSVTTIDNLGKSIVDPRYTKLSVDLLVDMARKRDAKHLEVSTGTFTDVEGNTVVNSKFQQQLPYLQAWDDFYLKEYERELKEETKVLKPKVELAETPSIEEGTTGMSFIEPTEKLSDLYGFGLKGTQRKAQLAMGFTEFTDLEQVMRLGGDTDEIIKKLDERGKIEEALNTIQSNKATPEEQQTAQRKIALYTLAQGLYTAQNIKNGSVPIKFGGTPSDTVRMTFKQAQQKGYKDVTRTGFGGVGAIVRLPATEPITKNIRIDKQALKKLAGVYPLIPKERLIEISATEPEEFPEEKSLYEAIYDVELEEGNELDEKLLKDFIIKQNELSQGIYKK
jgi:hypothetical protein